MFDLFSQQWIHAGKVHEDHGEFEKALFCFVAALKATKPNSDDGFVESINAIGKLVLSAGCQLISKPSESFLKQGCMNSYFCTLANDKFFSFNSF